MISNHETKTLHLCWNFLRILSWGEPGLSIFSTGLGGIFVDTSSPSVRQAGQISVKSAVKHAMRQGSQGQGELQGERERRQSMYRYDTYM